MQLTILVFAVTAWLIVSLTAAVLWGREQRHRGWKIGYGDGYDAAVRHQEELSGL